MQVIICVFTCFQKQINVFRLFELIINNNDVIYRKNDFMQIKHALSGTYLFSTKLRRFSIGSF